MWRKVLAAFTFIFMVPALSFAAQNYQDEIDAFFKLYESGKRIEAVDRIYSTNKWAAASQDAIHNIKTQLENIEQILGKYNGKEKIGELNVGGRFVHVTHMVLYDRQPLRMEFQFYRPQNDWIIYSFSFDVELTDEVQKSARQAVMTP